MGALEILFIIIIIINTAWGTLEQTSFGVGTYQFGVWTYHNLEWNIPQLGVGTQYSLGHAWNDQFGVGTYQFEVWTYHYHTFG